MSDTTILYAELPEEKENFTLTWVDGNEVSEYQIPAVKLDDRYNLELRDVKNENNIINYEEFISELCTIIDRTQERQGIDPSKRWLLYDAFPDENVGELLRDRNGLFSCRVRRRRPARMSADGTKYAQKGFRPELGYRTPEQFDRHIQVWVQRIELKLEIAAWATNGTVANKMALWLEDTLMSDTWRIKEAGAELFQWDERGPDTTQIVAGQKLQYRPLVFDVRLKKVREVNHPIIRHFNFNAGTISIASF